MVAMEELWAAAVETGPPMPLETAVLVEVVDHRQARLGPEAQQQFGFIINGSRHEIRI